MSLPEIVSNVPAKWLAMQKNKGGVLKWPNVRLQQVMPTTQPSAHDMKRIQKMIHIAKQQNGVGLAANQIGKQYRMIVVKTTYGSWLGMVNPEIKNVDQHMQTSSEGCLSIPGLYGDVKRHSKITVEYTNEFGMKKTTEFSGQDANVVQHEIDHLNGIMFFTKADPSTLHWIE